MMMLRSLASSVFLLVLLGWGLSAEEPNYAGINIATNTQFFTTVKNAMLPIAVEKVKNISIVNFTYPLDAKIINFTFSVNEVAVKQFSLDIGETGLFFQNDKAILELKDMNLAVPISLGFNSDPKIFFGEGGGHFNINDLLLRFEFQIGEVNKKFNLKILGMNTDLTNHTLELEMKGNNDVFTVVDKAFGLANPFLVSKFGGKIDPDMTGNLESIINDLLAGLSNQLELGPLPLFLDYSLTQNPKIGSEFLQLSFNSTVFTNETQGKPPIRLDPPKDLPVLDPTGESIQIFISEYTLNSALGAAYQSQILQINVTQEMIPETLPIKMDTTFLGTWRRYGL